jgi:hypothetical protein
LQGAIRKNWFLGLVAGLVFIMSGYRRLGLGVIAGAALWNLVLYGDLLLVRRDTRRTTKRGRENFEEARVRHV